MEFSHPVLFPEEAAPAQELANFSPVLLDLRRLHSHNVPVEALPVFDVNPSLLSCRTAPLQQCAHLPSMSWSTTEPTLPLNPYAWQQANVVDQDTPFDGSYICQEYNALGSVDSLALEDVNNRHNVYDSLIESFFCTNGMPCNSTNTLAAIGQGDALLMHKLTRNDSFLWSLLQSTQEFLPTHCTNQAIPPSFLGDNSSQSLINLRQETTVQYIPSIDCSDSLTGSHIICPLPSKVFYSELQTDFRTENELDKLAACPAGADEVHSIEQYFGEGHTMSNDTNSQQPSFTYLQGECIPEANSSGSMVSSSVITDADTECSVHSERPLASQFDRHHLQSTESSEKSLISSSWGSNVFKDLSGCSNQLVKSLVTTDLQILGSPLANVAPPVKRQKSCFTAEIASKSMHRQLQKNYEQELEGESSLMKDSSHPGSEPSNEITKPHRESVLQQPSTDRSIVSAPCESEKIHSQRKLLLTSIEPQSIAARQRRKKISERVRTLETLVPGGNRLDTASMLDEAIKYVKFLQLQVQILETIGNVNIGNSANLAVHENCCADNTHTSGSGIQSSAIFPRGPPASPLVLTEALQHQLFSSGYCLMSLQQCRSSSPRAP
ncbi:hypothetical protein O6H91_07G071600 [Diphasiastrum complanatum]|uniref:Uncharacterized protein n=1 Tax=Diphasiastrum complanatum TaxID=34168 RepID=A0ACC2D6I8_DIPCM|nr:hypothetical protein O6H91_07G071600 [Diphasiastrum complanatum]